jgi:peptidoglycan hydrolase-like protein with peptidoglycan-binding domain
MAIRDVGGGAKPGVGAGTAGGLPPTVEKGLNEAGLTQGGKSPKQAAQSLVGDLARAGFSAPAGTPKRDLAGQLAAALRAFQQANGLPANGQLTAATAQALKNAGVLGSPEDQQSLKKAERDGFERGAPSLLKQGERQRAELVNQGTPDTNFLDALLNQLGPGGPNEGTSATDIKGAAQATEAQAQNVDKKVAEAKKGEGVHKKGTAAEAQKDDLTPANQQLDRGTGVGVKVMRGLKTESTKTDEQRRRDALSGKDPTELGILDEEADEDAIAGTGEDGQKQRRGQGGDEEGAQAEGAEDRGSGGPGEEGRERDRGNASSGDEDLDDERRGHASIDDGSEDAAGHYRVPSMSEQAFAALEKIVRDAALENRATTYSWDVTFYKPGVYGPGQKAQELVHLVVDKATAFDPVWSKAQANLQALVSRTDPDGQVPSLDDIIQAIRQARSRDGDGSAGKLTKVIRPIGRA